MLIVEKEPKSIAAEAYRTLRTNIQYSSFDKELKTIIVTSSGPSEGKSTTSGNLALSMAQSDRKVLLVDCDLRKPTVHKKFHISNEKGLSNYLVGEALFEEVIVKYNENLSLLPAGTIPPNPAEMVASKKMKSFLDSLKGKFDCVLIDTPPVIAVTDAQILSTVVDGVLLVAASGQAEKEAATRAKELLLKVNANILGVVLTKVPLNEGKGYGYSYYYYYGNEDEESKKGRRHKK
ncbi:CpsD/CapB family tyrosine-protein kinase [Clostridium botulinum]|uniref:non-specific protein-tyrosine kinase n=1 Tax=Clostridium botulinum TaxID=1491 RepID=A0A9Q1UZJ0_CLOBO|nr:CpsD/CapB family tyrosine-protein kinase [Clostridium botulinum]AEB75386.1 capsular polysaccharide biosynthesis protein Cap1B [Clostridium botulinum BKT015925]KEH99902.1 capsular biosynthesis protein [Clostridium botulinum D str. 16868]KEI03778.1 capsular biosynthesis protein [Clostridium botulinum C/D str. Sp77]KLU76350.1 capsular biosynthesis protein [Clostridium botulinum V891]KOA73646.1 capsular biosynthesis protein [Clostridium botulinum]